ncbi:MAG: cytochrome c biogenesis protein CcdA [Thalassobaculum sp.]|uniref:cytochrome c biogenesis protein CcdA n=2 Tax=Thalassobaculum sp. TaxID=2022740 RepID=UPI0032EFFBFE
MEFTPVAMILLPIGLGLLGFIEPCTIGAHLIYLRSQGSLPISARLRSLTVFILVRSLVTGLFGAFVAYLGGFLIAVQTTLWLVFGFVYLVFALTLIGGTLQFRIMRVGLVPQGWRLSPSPILLGLAFGLNIPACSAPILFGLLGLAASLGTIAAGFGMMFLFGLFLSLPLALFLVVPDFVSYLESLRMRARSTRVLVGLVFAGLGLWSIWFGLFVDPADWAGR